jgi:hypothetical protein
MLMRAGERGQAGLVPYGSEGIRHIVWVWFENRDKSPSPTATNY